MNPKAHLCVGLGLLCGLASGQSAKPENFSDPSRNGFKFPPASPKLLEKDNRPEFTRELLSVMWRDGDRIRIFVIKPKNVAKPPVGLFLYSFPDTTLRFMNDKYCERIVSGGMAVVGFESALTGDRYVGRPLKQWFVSEMQESLGSTVHDVSMILDYVQSRSDLDGGRVGMFGTGSGAAIALVAAQYDHRIQAVDCLSPWGDWPTWMAKSRVIPKVNREQFTAKSYLNKIRNFEPVQSLRKLNVPVRLLLTEFGRGAVSEANETFEKVAPKSSVVIKLAKEGDLISKFSEGKLFQWLPEQLRKLPGSKSAAASSGRGQRNQG